MPKMLKTPGYAHIIERLRRSAVQIFDGRGGGSGVIWNDGSIVTNAHVVRGREAWILDASGRKSRARVMLCDREHDLALLEPVSLRDLVSPVVPAEIGDSDSLRPGHLVLALGNPFGLTGAVAAGVIHAVGPVESGPLDLGPRRNWVQADLRLAPGNSGGMLADATGRVIGINTMILRGLALAVPSNEVEAFVRCLHLKRTA
jgi:serine protease Do